MQRELQLPWDQSAHRAVESTPDGVVCREVFQRLMRVFASSVQSRGERLSAGCLPVSDNHAVSPVRIGSLLGCQLSRGGYQHRPHT